MMMAAKTLPFLILLIGSCGSAPNSSASRIVASAREQLDWGTTYDPRYVRLQFPNGDVPRTQGVCTDVVVRALRAVGKDLQRLIYLDKKANPALYPKYSSSRALDPNIDHRRCPNQRVFFRRFGRSLPLDTAGPNLLAWRPGDIVFWKLPNGRDHVGIVTDRKGSDGIPWVIHNLSAPAEEPVLTTWKIVGHFRYPLTSS